MCLHPDAPQFFNCFHGISFVSSRPRDAKVNYSLAEQVQLDDNYTTAGSRGGWRPSSMWELIRWFSSLLRLADAGWRRRVGEGGASSVGAPPPCSLRGKEAARGESHWDGKTTGRGGGGGGGRPWLRGAGPC